MTTEVQNEWAQALESASQTEIRQMAEWAIEHIEDAAEVRKLKAAVDEHLWCLGAA